MQLSTPKINFTPQLGPGLEASLDQTKFGRAFKAHEWQGYQDAVNTAKERLGVKQLALATPIRSLPTTINTGVGSLHGAQPFLKFIQKLGFTHLQVDPAGAIQTNNISPYMGTLFSYNPWQIDLKPLESKAWGELLPEGTTELIAEGNKEHDSANIEHVAPQYKDSLKMAFEAFQEKRKTVAKQSHDFQILLLGFEDFKKQNASWLLPDSLYEVLSTKEYGKITGSDYWKNWSGPYAALDKTLMSPDNKVEKQKRIESLQKKYSNDLENYAFTQFIASQQQQIVNEGCKTSGLGLLADKQVGFSNGDAWANQHLFLKDWVLGCPPDFYTAAGQTWGMPVIDPEKIFNKDGSVNQDGTGTKFLRQLYGKMFQDFHGGLRIDHTIGLIDPWVYAAGANTTSKGSRLFSSPENPKLNKYSRIDQKSINKNLGAEHDYRVKEDALKNPLVLKRYASLIMDVIIPEAEKAGIPKEGLIFEDLGTLTTPVVSVFKNYKLAGMRVSQYTDPNNVKCLQRPKTCPPQSWIMAGTADASPVWYWAKNMSLRDKWQHAKRLVQDWFPLNPTAKQNIVKNLYRNTPQFVEAIFTELFLSPAKNVLIFFGDFLGWEKKYNQPGLFDDKQNWRLRIPQQFEKAYFDAVKAGKALNLPQILSNALQVKALQTRAKRLTAYDENLVKNLNHYAEILNS